MHLEHIQEQLKIMLPTGQRYSLEPVTGGDSHQSFRVSGGSHDELFLKANTLGFAACLASEHQSLQQLRLLGRKDYPKPVAFIESEKYALLLMSFQHYTRVSERDGVALARALAAQHHEKHERFGWQFDNYIGLTPQENKWSSSWVDFFRAHRLKPQLEMAIRNDLNNRLIQKIQQLAKSLEDYIDDKLVFPSLLHGDLWAGNVAFDLKKQTAAFFEPAPYYGDREVDIAMTHLFGGFPTSFYDAYHEAFPLESGHQARKFIYNLYHALNHFNLFGRAYESLIDNCLYSWGSIR